MPSLTSIGSLLDTFTGKAFEGQKTAHIVMNEFALAAECICFLSEKLGTKLSSALENAMDLDAEDYDFQQDFHSWTSAKLNAVVYSCNEAYKKRNIIETEA